MLKKPFPVDEGRFGDLFEKMLGASFTPALVIFRNNPAPAFVASTLLQAAYKGKLPAVLKAMENTFGMSRPNLEHAKEGFSNIWRQCGLGLIGVEHKVAA